MKDNIMNLTNTETIEISKKITKPKTEEKLKTTFNKIENLKSKFSSEALDKLRKIDFLNQHINKLPEVDLRDQGLVTAWICDTPKNSYRQAAKKQGYIDANLEEYPSVSSGYSDITGESKYDHYLMIIPKEIYDKKQKVISDLTNQQYGSILNPNSKREDIQGDGIYNPGTRIIKNNFSEESDK